MKRSRHTRSAPRTGVDQHDLERRQRVPDALELFLHVIARHDVAVRKVAEVELDTGLKAPLERHLIDRERAAAVILGRGEVVGCVEVRAVVRDESHALDRPGFAVRKVLGP
jgi:hypothetical protein